MNDMQDACTVLNLDLTHYTFCMYNFCFTIYEYFVLFDKSLESS